MGTRSAIVKLSADGKQANCITCGYDGYFEGVGADLQRSANTKDLVEKLFCSTNTQEVWISDVESALTVNSEDGQDIEISEDLQELLESLAKDIFVEYVYIWVPVDISNFQYLENILDEDIPKEQYLETGGFWIASEYCNPVKDNANYPKCFRRLSTILQEIQKESAVQIKALNAQVASQTVPVKVEGTTVNAVLTGLQEVINMLASNPYDKTVKKNCISTLKLIEKALEE